MDICCDFNKRVCHMRTVGPCPFLAGSSGCWLPWRKGWHGLCSCSASVGVLGSPVLSSALVAFSGSYLAAPELPVTREGTVAQEAESLMESLDSDTGAPSAIAEDGHFEAMLGATLAGEQGAGSPDAHLAARKRVGEVGARCSV